jgi:hypothetical protein
MPTMLRRTALKRKTPLKPSALARNDRLCREFWRTGFPSIAARLLTRSPTPDRRPAPRSVHWPVASS